MTPARMITIVGYRLMEMDRTSLICISTVLSSDNFYSKLLGLKDERGRDFFVSVCCAHSIVCFF